MGDDVTDVIRVRRIVLHDDAHDPADKLNVGSKAPKRAKNSGDTQLRVVETLAEHLHLNDAVERTVPKRAHDRRLLVVALLAMDDIGVVPALLVERPDLARVANRACNPDQLVSRSALP